MHLRTFHAASIQEAIRQARQELGADAMLLNSRRVTGAEAKQGAANGQLSGEGGNGNANGAAATAGDSTTLFAVTFATASPGTANATKQGGSATGTNGKSSPASAPGAIKTQDPRETFDSASTRADGAARGEEVRRTAPPLNSQLTGPLGYDLSAAKDAAKPVRDGEAQAAGGMTSRARGQATEGSDEATGDSHAMGRRARASTEHVATEGPMPSYEKLFEQMTSMRREMLQLAGSVRKSGADTYRQELPSEELRWAYDAMVAQEFSLDLVEDVIDELAPRFAPAAGTATTKAGTTKGRRRKRSVQQAEEHPARSVLSSLRDVIAQKIELAAEPSLRRRTTKPQLVVLVGPPGVGKTTTLVKLAARFGATSRFPLQIISMDNYRVGASEQLRTYSSILGVGFDALPSATALERALASYQAKDLILIDTPGYGWRDFPAASDLAALLREEAHTSIHLTISASMKPSDVARVADLYEVFDYDALLFTKIDETATIGPMVSESVLRRKPLSYFCAGQRIPDDLEVASRERLLDRMLPVAASDEFAA
jgi:flagellar biosynthesis protein FlhF